MRATGLKGEATAATATTLGSPAHRARRRSGDHRVRTSRASGQPRLLAASLALAAPAWVGWLLDERRNVVLAVLTTVIPAANIGLTRSSPTFKRRIVGLFQKYILNPPIRSLVLLGLLPVGYALVETTGRISGKSRRTPVGNGLVCDTFWIVAEHGHRASYVRNLQADPRVRVRVRRGVRPIWRTGVAHILGDDDPHSRQRMLSRWHPLRALNAAVVRVMGTELLTIRIDLDANVSRAMSAHQGRATR